MSDENKSINSKQIDYWKEIKILQKQISELEKLCDVHDKMLYQQSQWLSELQEKLKNK